MQIYHNSDSPADGFLPTEKWYLYECEISGDTLPVAICYTVIVILEIYDEKDFNWIYHNDAIYECI